MLQFIYINEGLPLFNNQLLFLFFLSNEFNPEVTVIQKSLAPYL